MLLKTFIILVNVSILKTKSESSLQLPFCMGDVCYIRPESESGRNWAEAQQICKSSTPISAKLPIADSVEHQMSFEAAARCLTTADERNLGIWIGAKASYNSQPIIWTWLDGSNYPETEVPSQEGYYKSYAFLQDTSSEVGPRVYASDPKGSYSYICQYSTSADLCTNGTGFSVENRCFVIFHERMSWFSARNACLARDGDLASFKNISLLEGKIGIDAFWVGLRSMQWNWQRAADSSSDVTFTLWSSGEPDDNASSCISTDEGDKFPNWRDYNCSESLPFICQFTASPPSNPSLAICATPSTTTVTSKHTDAASASLRPSTIGKNSATTPSGSSAKPLASSTTPLVSSNEDRQKNGTGSVDAVALGVGLGVGIGVPVILALIVVVIIISVRRKRRNRQLGRDGANFESGKPEIANSKEGSSSPASVLSTVEGDHYQQLQNSHELQEQQQYEELQQATQYEQLQRRNELQEQQQYEQLPQNPQYEQL